MEILTRQTKHLHINWPEESPIPMNPFYCPTSWERPCPSHSPVPPLCIPVPGQWEVLWDALETSCPLWLLPESSYFSKSIHLLSFLWCSYPCPMCHFWWTELLLNLVNVAAQDILSVLISIQIGVFFFKWRNHQWRNMSSFHNPQWSVWPLFLGELSEGISRKS